MMLSMESVLFHSCFPLCNVSSLLRHTMTRTFLLLLFWAQEDFYTSNLTSSDFDGLCVGKDHVIPSAFATPVGSNIFSFSEMSRTLCHSAMAARNGTVFLQVSFCQRWRQDSRDAAAWKVPCHQTLELYALQPFLGPSIEPMYKKHVYPYASVCHLICIQKFWKVKIT